VKECFKTEKEDGMVNFLLMGDSRIRNIADYLENVVTNHSIPWFEKAHRHINKFYPDVNLNLDFLWAPLTEFHQNRGVLNNIIRWLHNLGSPTINFSEQTYAFGA
jgi:hypothetical protein